MELPSYISEAARSGQVQPDAVGQLLDQHSSAVANEGMRRGWFDKSQLDTNTQKIRKAYQPQQANLENDAYRSTGNTYMPSTLPEVGGAVASGLLLPYAMDQGIYHARRGIGALRTNGFTAGYQQRRGVSEPRARAVVQRAMQRNLGPKPTLMRTAKGYALNPLMLALNEIPTFFRPLSDPAYQRGERGYFSSMIEGRKGDIEQYRKKTNDLYNQYGVASLPLNALHAVLNPATAIMSGGSAIKDQLFGKSGALAVEQAELAVRRALHSEA